MAHQHRMQMKYSTRLRRGIAHWPRQSHGYYYATSTGDIEFTAHAAYAACALGAMVDPETASAAAALVLSQTLNHSVPIHTLPRAPAGGLGEQIQYANDEYRWTREEIANALEAAGY